ncbi:17842_t:CDS:2 [Cetraspora pellucida]|uniref:17842_t:CDS:1 n=1 Tax=Cetraspora pellucida TaxID=1433469 RepID=A0A9N9AVS1_9GLOM|nr:17842_t:CDS:2 [Cetraspora pellucida]
MPVVKYQYVYQQLTNHTLVAKNFYSYFGFTSLSDGIDALRKLLESLRDDTKFGDNVKRYLKRNDFFTNDRVEPYFARKVRKGKEKIATETTLNMANQRLNLATEVVHKNVLNHLGKEANNLGENENDEQKEAKSSTHLVEDYNNSNTQTKDFHRIGIIKRGHFNFSDTDCTSQISDDHWDKIIIPFLTKHKLKNAFSTEDDEQMLINMFGEENKKKLLEPGNLNLIYSLTDIEEDAIKVLEIVSRIRLVLYLKEFSVCQTLTSLEKKWPTSLPSDLLDKRLRDILWASELIKWVIMQWQDGTFLKEMKEQWIKTQLASRLLVPLRPVKPGEIESNAEKIVSNYNKALILSKIKSKTRVDGLDDDEEFENVWVELKGGFGNYHEAENQNNREDLGILLKGFSIMSTMQALTLPEDAKKNIGDLEFFGIRGIGNHFQFWGSFQASQYLMCSYLLGEFRLPSFEGREGSGIQDLLYAIKIVYSFKVRVEASKLKFHQIRALARSKRIFEADSSPIKAKRVREQRTYR